MMLPYIFQIDDGDLGRIRRSIIVVLSLSVFNWYYEPTFHVESVPKVLSIGNEGLIDTRSVAGLFLVFSAILGIRYVLKFIALRDVGSKENAKLLHDRATQIKNEYDGARTEINSVFAQMKYIKDVLPSGLSDAREFFEPFSEKEGGISRLMLFPVLEELASVADDYASKASEVQAAASALQKALNQRPRDEAAIESATKKLNTCANGFVPNHMSARILDDNQTRIAACKRALTNTDDRKNKLASSLAKFLETTENHFLTTTDSYLKLLDKLASKKLHIVEQAVDASSNLNASIRADTWDRNIEFWITIPSSLAAIAFNVAVLSS